MTGKSSPNSMQSGEAARQPFRFIQLGWETWIRTKVTRFRAACPTARRSPKDVYFIALFPGNCYNNPNQDLLGAEARGYNYWVSIIKWEFLIIQIK